MSPPVDRAGTVTPGLTTEVQFLAGVGPDRAARFQRLGVSTARDLLFLFPRDYECPAPAAAVPALQDGAPASLEGEIVDAELASRTPGRCAFGAIVQNETGAVRILFFNQPFRAEQITVGRRVRISGTPRLKGLRMEFVHPIVTFLGEGEEVGGGEILPIYPLTEGIRQTDLRRLSARYVPELAGQLTEVLPESIRKQAAEALAAAGIDVGSELPAIDETLVQLHRPRDQRSLGQARLRLIFQELFVMQLALAMRRRKLTSDLQAPPLPPSPIIHARILQRFPFEPTEDQRRAIAEIAFDMSRQFPMNRLLQGDVGSGKTFVAIYAMMLAVAHGYQAVLMAPTEILARQHERTLRETLRESRVRIGLLCGSLTAAERRQVTGGVADGSIDLLVGTQALLHHGLAFARLGLCVIDEQHKFGVHQRVTLRNAGIDPHTLVMSATPIPRSIAMTLFGDVDLTTLREKPPGRQAVHTYLGRDDWKERWWSFLKQRLDEGRQAYVVAPRVETRGRNPGEDETDSQPDDDEAFLAEENEREDEPENGGEDVASVHQVYESLCNGPLSDYRVGLLHGRMNAEEKQAIMRSFAAGDLQVLVSTTVIEVGIDVPNATVMTILGANRFGLAQLHQLRGRVSRGSHAGHVCVFIDGDGSPEDVERLRVFEQTSDGFTLAEADFRLRGPGDLLGKRQSGLPPLRVADLTRDESILAVARELARDRIELDPDLAAPELAELRSQVFRRYGKRLSLGDVA